MSAPPSYIGISGLVSRTEVLAALAAFPDCGRQLMVGVLASEKTLAGQTNRYFRRYPKVQNIAGIFSDDPRALNLVHYGADTPPDGDTLARLFELAGHRCHGFQFNGAWPMPDDLRKLHRAFGRAGRACRIVMQIGRGAIDGMGNIYPLALLGRYVDRELVTDALIDASGGTGQPLNVSTAEGVLEQLRRAFPSLGIGVAGGLFAATVPQVARLLQAGASVDAESGLRDGADGGGRLDADRVKAYLGAAAEAIWDACEHDEQKLSRAGVARACSVCGAPSVYCHPCSEAGGADRAIYHAPPACPGREAVRP